MVIDYGISFCSGDYLNNLQMLLSVNLDLIYFTLDDHKNQLSLPI